MLSEDSSGHSLAFKFALRAMKVKVSLIVTICSIALSVVLRVLRI